MTSGNSRLAAAQETVTETFARWTLLHLFLITCLPFSTMLIGRYDDRAPAPTEIQSIRPNESVRSRPITGGITSIAAIIASVERLSQQIESVLDLTQSEAGLLPIATSEVDLLSFVTGVVREREEPIEAKNLTLDQRGDKSAGTVEADKRQLGRAIGNLLDNAIAAVPEEGRILVALSRGKRGARIVISDNGPGMKPSELARALDGYGIGPDGKPSARRGGLGLPLARQLIEGHGGRLELQSEPGAGTTATILLP